MSRGFSPTTQKVMLLLAGGLGLGFARTPKQQFRIIKETAREWKKINNKKLNQAIKTLYQNKLISAIEDENGITKMVINDSGKRKILTYDLDKLEIKKRKYGTVYGE